MAGLTLATKPEFVEMREDFYQWWSHIAASGMSAWDARDDMEKRIAEYQRLIKEDHSALRNQGRRRLQWWVGIGERGCVRRGGSISWHCRHSRR